MTELQNVCEIIVDSEHKTAPTSDTGHPMVRTPNIGRGRFILANAKLVEEDIYHQWTRRAVPQPGDIILAREAPVGNVAMIPPGLTPILGQRTVLLRPDRGKVEPRYLQYLLLGDTIQHRMSALASGATVAHLNMADIRMLPLPPLPERSTQEKLASVLGAYDELIENNLRRIEILEETAQTFYREWFVNFRFPGHENVEFVDSELGSIPANWEVAKLGDHVELAYGKGLRATDRRGGSVPVYGSGGIIGYHDMPLVPGPGIVVGRKGNVGAVHWSHTDFFPIDTTYYVKSDLPLTFLNYCLRAQQFIDSHAAVPGLSRNQAYGNPIQVPDPTTLNTFHVIADSLLSMQHNLRLQVANLRAARDLLLPKLISGEIDVSELDIDTTWLAT